MSQLDDTYDDDDDDEDNDYNNNNNNIVDYQWNTSDQVTKVLR